MRGHVRRQPVTHVGWGAAEVKEVASNRRILGPDGKVRATRYTATKDPGRAGRADGVIDPRVALVSFWNEDKPLAVLSYYACHPQSYYRTGIPNPDFPGIARFIRGQAVPEALHVHFNGAGGNIGAGKYNDGAKDNRVALAMRLADGMTRAWEATREDAADGRQRAVARARSVALPPAPHLDERQLRADVAKVSDPGWCRKAPPTTWPGSCAAAKDTRSSWRCSAWATFASCTCPASCSSSISSPPSRCDPISTWPWPPTATTALATSAPTRAYDEGGYETSQRAHASAPQVETVLLSGMRKLLEAK